MDTTVPNNPYVGPRSIKTGEAFFGRDKEIRSLSALLVAERIVLLHSPSGAGKSSLIQAGLMPRMTERFSVFPLVRVNLEPPEEVRGLEGLNRYVLSTLLSLEEGLPTGQQIPLAELATLTLDAYLEQRSLPDETLENGLLLFDQFEEILTVSPTDVPVKQAFFEQLGEALQNRRRWALFAVREDYMGGLAPYVRAIPNRLNVTFRLGLLGSDAAKLAIQQPARNKEVDFTDGATQKLVDDLRRIQVQQPDGSFVTEEGPNIEPVQLQVVCYNLWQSHAADDKIIDEGDLQRVGSVDQALASYYANAVRSVAESTNTDERLLRQWFDEHLITPEGIRSQVLKGAENTEGLPNIILRLLENTHLIRGETRAGKTWYELAHDRLVKPVRDDNTIWFEQNLSLLQRQSVLWNQQGRGEGLLLRGKELEDAEKETLSLRLTDDEGDFLAACRGLRQREQRERRRNIFMTILAIGATIAMVIAVTFYVQSQIVASRNSQLLEEQQQKNTELEKTLDTLKQAVINQVMAKERADRLAKDAAILADEAAQQARISRARELAALARAQGDAWPQRRLLLSLAAQKILNSGDPSVQEVDDALREAVTRITPHATLDPKAGPIYVLAFRGSQFMASSGQDGVVRFWDMENLDKPPVLLTGPTSSIHVMVFSPDGAWLAAGGDDGNVYLWEIAKLDAAVKIGTGHTAAIRALAFSKDGKTLVSGGDDRDLYLWSVTNMATPLAVFRGIPDQPGVTAPTPTPNPYNPPQPPSRHASSIIQINFVLSTKFQSISEDGLKLTWDINAPQYHQVYGGDDATYVSDRNSELRVGGSYLGMAITALTTIESDRYYTDTVIGTSEGLVLFVRPSWGGDSVTTLVGHERAIYSVVASDDGEHIVSAGEEGIIRVWNLAAIRDANLSNFENNLDAQGPNLLINEVDRVYGLSFDEAGKYLVVSGRNGATTLWDWNNLKKAPIKIETVDSSYAKISADGRWLAQVLDEYGYYYDEAPFDSGQDKYLELVDLSQADQEPLGLSQDSSIALAFSPDNHWLAYQEKLDIILYDLKKQEVSLKLSGHEAKLISMTFSPDSRWLVSADLNSQAILWDLSAPTPTPKNIGQYANPFYSLTFSSSGKYLGAGDTWGSLLIWNFTNLLGGQLEPLRLFEQGCEKSYSSIDFNPDETLLVQSCHNVVFLRNMKKAYAIQTTIYPNQEVVYQVKFSRPDGDYLAVGGQGNTVYLYPVGSKILRNLVCKMAGRNLTNQEWLEFFPGESYQTLCP